MRWFKHLSGSLDDAFVSSLIERFGGDGYLVFFGVLEILSEEFDAENPGKVTESYKFFTRKLQVSRRKFVRILTFCHENLDKKTKKRRLKVSFSETSVTVECPRFIELCDDYTKRLLRTDSEQTTEQTPEKVPPKKKKKVIEGSEGLEGTEDLKIPPNPPRGTIPYQEIISYLNMRTGKNFNYTGNVTQRHIKARWKEGFRLEHFKQVIDTKVSKWFNDPKMMDFLRPSTLFGSKFESYLNEVDSLMVKKLGTKGAKDYLTSAQWAHEREQKENEK